MPEYDLVPVSYDPFEDPKATTPRVVKPAPDVTPARPVPNAPHSKLRSPERPTPFSFARKPFFRRPGLI
jgi:hypothetical protein